jgi:single-strand DNA-binding protein
MASLNKVLLIGNLTRDPDIRRFGEGRMVADLRLAVNRRFKKDGVLREETCFVGVSVFERQAEICQQYLRKGSPVLVEGRLKYDEWEKEGQKFNKLSVVADRVQFLPKSEGGGERGAEEPADVAEAPPPRAASPARPQPAAPADAPPAEAVGGDAENLPF